jgi:molybdenum cofactor guanylyltransferase
MSAHSHILGVILAGGRAQRMGGGDKGFADFGGQPILAHVIERFQPQVPHLILNANGDASRFVVFGLPVVPDLENARDQGPMSGIAAAMDWAMRASPVYSAIATVTTDSPFLPPDLVSKLAAANADGLHCGPAIAQSADRRHPAIGLWPLTLKSAVHAALSAQKLSVNDFARAHGAIAVSFPLSDSSGEPLDPFFNANTPDDLATARGLLARRPKTKNLAPDRE